MVRTKVFVGNLSFQTQEAELAAEFGTAGKVISANIITRGPRSLGYGFVEMDSEEDAQNAVKLMSKKEINGREINVEIAKPQDETKEKQPRQKPEGEARKPKRKPAKKDEGSQPSQKREAEDSDEKDDDERPRRQRNRKSRGTAAPGQKRVSTEEREESKTTLFVANLPFSLDDEGFAKIITELSLKLKSAHVVKKRNGRSKGYGFVEFDSQDDQQKALTALNKKVVENRELSVKVALTEIRREDEQEEKKPADNKAASFEKKPADNKSASFEKKVAPADRKGAPAENKASPYEKKVVPAEKKAVPAEKKVVPAEKKAVNPVVPAEKKAATPVVPAEKKTASPAPAEKKTASPAPTEKKEEKKEEKKAVVPAEKKTASPAPAEKKAATPEKKDEKK